MNQTRRDEGTARGAALAAMVVAAGVALPGAAGAQSYTQSTASRTLTSIRTSGTPLYQSGYDDNYGSFAAPFSFPFFGASVTAGTTLYPSTNGLLAIGNPSSAYSNAFIPSSGEPNNFIAPFWDDLMMLQSGDIFWQVTGSGSGAVLTVEWYNAAHLSAQSETFNFQVRILASGVIELIYGARIGGSAGSGWSGSIGLENATGSAGAALACGDICTPNDVPSGTAVIFTPSAMPPQLPDLRVRTASGFRSTLTEGDVVNLSFTVENIGGAASASTYVGLFAGTSAQVTTGDYELEEVFLPGVPAGGAQNGSMQIFVPSLQGTWYAALIIDPWGDISESNRNNNTHSLGAFTVTSGGGDEIFITTSFLPDAEVGTSYDFQLQQTGATSPTWRIDFGQLPPGMALSPQGRLMGTPTAAGEYHFVVGASQTGFQSDFAELGLVVHPGGGGGGLRFSSTTLPQARVGVPYAGMLTASGGVPPYAFQAISGAPEWLTVVGSGAEAGALRGTPSAAGNHQLVIAVTDSRGDSVTGSAQLQAVMATELAIAGALPEAVVGRLYRAPVLSGGVPPYTVDVVSGSLPEGFAFDPSSGELVGSPGAAGSATFRISASDSNSPQGSVEGELTLRTVEFQELRMTVNDVTVTTNTDVNFALSAAGGVPPYAWSLTAGTLLEGLSLLPEGRIVGRVTSTGSEVVTLAVSDADGARVERELTVRAQVFRAPDSGRGGSGRTGRSGCSATGGASGAELLALLALLGLWPRRRR